MYWLSMSAAMAIAAAWIINFFMNKAKVRIIEMELETKWKGKK